MNMYRRITGIATTLFLTVLVVVSCSEDEEVLKEDQLIGSWALESQEIKNVVATVQGISLPLDDVPQVREVLDTIAVFPEDAVLTFAEDQTYTVVASSVNGNALEGTWSLSDNGETITITGLDDAAQLLGSNSLTFVIQSFTDTNLSLLATIPEITLPEGIDIPNVPNLGTISLSGDYQLDLKKQQ